MPIKIQIFPTINKKHSVPKFHTPHLSLSLCSVLPPETVEIGHDIYQALLSIFAGPPIQRTLTYFTSFKIPPRDQAESNLNDTPPTLYIVTINQNTIDLMITFIPTYY